MLNKISPFIFFSKTYPEWEGHIAFTENAGMEWRNRFGANSTWGVDLVFGEGSRNLLQKLNPSFYPEDEFLIWDPWIDPDAPSGTKIISKIDSPRLTLDKGMCFGTEFRMIWGNVKQGLVAQVLYSEIRKVERGDGLIRLHLSNSEQLEILFSIKNNPNNDPNEHSYFSKLTTSAFRRRGQPTSPAISSKNELNKYIQTIDFNPIILLEDFFKLIIDQNNSKEEHGKVEFY